MMRGEKMNYKLRLLMLAALAVSSSALATEFRTPYLSDRGPLRHSFKKLNKDKMNLNTWSTVYTKEAHKAFLKHGGDSKPLTKLLFNESTFTFNEIFENSNVPLTSPNYNPFLSLIEYSPRAKYFEWGATFGGCIDFPVWKEDNGRVKGRVGLRATIPFRTIEVEREDITPQTGIGQDAAGLAVTGIINVQRQDDGTQVAAANRADIEATAYRLDLVQALRSSSGNSAIIPGNNSFKIFGQEIAAADAAGAGVGLAHSNANGKPEFVAWQRGQGAEDLTVSALADAHVTAIAADLMTTANEVKFFSNAVDYSGIDFTNPAIKAELAQDWLVFKRSTQANNDDKLFGAQAQTVQDLIADRLRQYKQDALGFLADQGFVFDSYKRSGLGDIDLDVFYEHTFSKHMLAELILGVRFPVGTTKSNCGNPYRGIAKLGNGEHFEIKLGANFAWDACKWFSLKLDLSYNFVLESKEKRAAVFAGSTVKNIGPCTDADVDWGYFIGRLDFQFVHPKTCCLSTIMGYEFYYKTEDHLTFKKTSIPTWLGTDDAPVLGTLDSKLARKHTESISHKARMESTYKANKYLDIFWGGAIVFAGQNIFRDMDAHGGFNVRF